jgi:hypothetical protein
MPQNEADNTHYILHVRVEKVVTTPNQGLKAATGSAKDRQVEDVVNVVKKSDFLTSGIEFIKGVLELTRENEA